MATTKSQADRLESTVEGLNENFEKTRTTGASARITGWINTLKGQKGFSSIVSDLQKLKEAVSAKDSQSAYMLMEKLGEATIASAEKAEAGEAAAIKRLGQTLLKCSKLAKKLVG